MTHRAYPATMFSFRSTIERDRFGHVLAGTAFNMFSFTYQIDLWIDLAGGPD